MMQSSINFIGIGSQKSGTSWLFKQFEQSNQIDLPPIKELHYFDRSESYPSPNFLSQTKLTSRLFNLKWLAKALLKIKDEEENKLWYKKWFFSDYTKNAQQKTDNRLNQSTSPLVHQFTDYSTTRLSDYPIPRKTVNRKPTTD
jgi:hypothetical protein